MSAEERREMSPWLRHVMAVRKEKGLSLKEAMKVAKETYRKK